MHRFSDASRSPTTFVPQMSDFAAHRCSAAPLTPTYGARCEAAASARGPCPRAGQLRVIGPARIPQSLETVEARAEHRPRLRAREPSIPREPALEFPFRRHALFERATP